jgi:hypothetical protein
MILLAIPKLMRGLGKSVKSAQIQSRSPSLREGTRGSGIIRFREESDWPLKWNA